MAEAPPSMIARASSLSPSVLLPLNAALTRRTMAAKSAVIDELSAS